ncbi:hypothetical protein VNO77_04739 [Canavalia gladiata]|uniref:Uncharacterized protein n=1 Tax=Canavalia gladiata TaxID=3824 RepID=A0AAN9MZ23_CANGL
MTMASKTVQCYVCHTCMCGITPHLLPQPLDGNATQTAVVNRRLYVLMYFAYLCVLRTKHTCRPACSVAISSIVVRTLGARSPEGKRGGYNKDVASRRDLETGFVDLSKQCNGSRPYISCLSFHSSSKLKKTCGMPISNGHLQSTESRQHSAGNGINANVGGETRKVESNSKKYFHVNLVHQSWVHSALWFLSTQIPTRATKLRKRKRNELTAHQPKPNTKPFI